MAHVSFSAHDVKSVILGEIKHLSEVSIWTRMISIISKDGSTVSIDLFSADSQALLLKNPDDEGAAFNRRNSGIKEVKQ